MKYITSSIKHPPNNKKQVGHNDPPASNNYSISPLTASNSANNARTSAVDFVFIK